MSKGERGEGGGPERLGDSICFGFSRWPSRARGRDRVERRRGWPPRVSPYLRTEEPLKECFWIVFCFLISSWIGLELSVPFPPESGGGWRRKLQSNSILAGPTARDEGARGVRGPDPRYTLAPGRWCHRNVTQKFKRLFYPQEGSDFPSLWSFNAEENGGDDLWVDPDPEGSSVQQ